jgi:hypothetical protein
MNENDQLLNTFPAIIDIPSILIDLIEEPDQTIITQRNKLINQIHTKVCVRFFKVNDRFNNLNFDVIKWINCDKKNLFVQ